MKTKKLTSARKGKRAVIVYRNKKYRISVNTGLFCHDGIWYRYNFAGGGATPAQSDFT